VVIRKLKQPGSPLKPPGLLCVFHRRLFDHSRRSGLQVWFKVAKKNPRGVASCGFDDNRRDYYYFRSVVSRARAPLARLSLYLFFYTDIAGVWAHTRADF
jgi:hypothetical protein